MLHRRCNEKKRKRTLWYTTPMSNSQHYGGAIWTNHALERLLQRGLSQDMAFQAFSSPDRSFSGKQPGTTEFQRRFNQHLVTIIAKPNEKHEWIILSCWIDPPMIGTQDAIKQDAYRKFQKNYRTASGWHKMWLLFLKQVKYLITGKQY